MAEEEKKRHQHYVWWNYLAPWVTNDKFVFCLRLKDGKIIQGGRTGVGNQNDFYRLVDLRPDEVDLIIRLAVEKTVPLLRPIAVGWINAFTLLFNVRDQLIKDGVNLAEIEEKLDIAANNLEENLHAEMERKAAPYLERIIAGDLGFFLDEQGNLDFMLFLCTQYLRTKRTLESVSTSVGAKHEETLRRIWGAMKHIFGSNMAWVFFSQRESFKYTSLENPTSVELITGDQPVVNTHATRAPNGKIVDELEFYYPVSPTKALLVGRRTEGEPAIQAKTLTEAEVRSYNNHIANQAHEQLYAKTKSSLEPYVSMPASSHNLGGDTVKD